jgi:ABC-type polysaccharide/polyol phosphate export permease
MKLRVIRDWFSGTNKLERFWLLAKIEFKLRYYENILGLVWALIKPLSDIAIYYLAFGIIMHNDTPQFVSFLFIGIIFWNFFVESSSGTVQLLATKKYLYEYTNMNKIEIYLSVIGSNLIGLFFNFCMFIIYFVLLEHGETHLSWHIIFILPILLNLIILSLAFSLILSNLYIIAKDITQVWMIIVNVAFWISPILFPPDIFMSKMPIVRYLNPFSSVVINAREVILYHHLPEWKLFLWGYFYSAFFLLIGIYLLNTLGSKAAEKL